MSVEAGRRRHSPVERSQGEHLTELRMQARYHRDRHRLYAARMGSSRPWSLSKLQELKRTRELAESRLRRAEGEAGKRGATVVDDPHKPRDLQREADTNRPWTVRSEEDSVRLEKFKEGKLDRWGRQVDRFTKGTDLYIERQKQGELW